ncbi:MAG: nuclear transport factor 2 family protein [Terriglobales bacterium]
MSTTVKKRLRRTVRKATPSGRKSARPTSATATIREIGRSWPQNWNTNDLEKLVAAYAPDAVYLPPHHEAVHGRDSIRDYLRVPRSHGVSDLAFDVTYIKQSGDVAWDVGLRLVQFVGAHLSSVCQPNSVFRALRIARR